MLSGIASSMSEPALSSAAVSSSIAPTADKPGQLASAANIAKPFQDAITQATAARASEGKKLAKLVGILATPSPPSVAYAQWTKKACEQVGIAFDIWKTWEDKPEEGASPAMDVDEVKRPDSDLEADVEDLFRNAARAGGITQLRLGLDFDVSNTLARVLGLRDI